MPWLLDSSRSLAWSTIHLYFSQRHPFDRNRFTELNLREVYQMVMQTVVSYMKYLTHSGLNKIVHYNGILRTRNDANPNFALCRMKVLSGGGLNGGITRLLECSPS